MCRRPATWWKRSTTPGRHRWSYAYQTPTVTHPPLALDNTLGELIDNPDAYALVMGVIVQHHPQFMQRMEDQTELTLRQALAHNPRTARLGPEIETVLASLQKDPS